MPKVRTILQLFWAPLNPNFTSFSVFIIVFGRAFNYYCNFSWSHCSEGTVTSPLQRSCVYNVHFFGRTDHRFIDSSILSFSSEKAKWANWARTVWKFQSTRLQPSSTGFYQFLMSSKYSKNSRIPVTRTLRGNEKQFELVRVRGIGVDWKIQYAMLEIDIYWSSQCFSVWWSTNLIISSETVR